MRAAGDKKSRSGAHAAAARADSGVSSFASYCSRIQYSQVLDHNSSNTLSNKKNSI